jgi:hypothetical protein
MKRLVILVLAGTTLTLIILAPAVLITALIVTLMKKIQLLLLSVLGVKMDMEKAMTNALNAQIIANIVKMANVQVACQVIIQMKMDSAMPVSVIVLNVIHLISVTLAKKVTKSTGILDFAQDAKRTA